MFIGFSVNAALGLAAYIAIGAGALWLIPKFSRTEAKSRSVTLVLAVMVMSFAVALAYPSFNQSMTKKATLAQLDEYCKASGEQIWKVVSDVQGVYIRPPIRSLSGHDYHENDLHGDAYVRAPSRLYQFHESPSFRTEGFTDRFESKQKVTDQGEQPKLPAKYGVTWKGLTSIQETNNGLHGDETVIFDRATREILAKRTFYYYKDRSSGTSSTYGKNSHVTCPQVKLGTDIGYIDSRPRDSYQFVSKVLKPVALNSERNISLYDLAPGSGQKKKDSCYLINLGEGVSPENVLLEKREDDLAISINGSNDVLLCSNYYGAMSPAASPGPNYRIKFVDGTAWTDADIRRRLK